MPPVLDIRNLVVEYSARGGLRRAAAVRAVDGISLCIDTGESVGLVGESGSGKSSVARAILGLVPTSNGQVRLNGIDLATCRGRAARTARRQAQLIMQDPFEALDPHLTVAQIVEEPLIVHELERNREARTARVARTLDSVGLAPPEEFACRHPHELSGGQRQRVCIAACLTVDPDLLIADEPVSMLDVSVRASVLHLLDSLRTSRAMSIMMITHDLPTASAFCDRLIVMRGGVIIEEGPAADVVSKPREPYTQELLTATPRLRRPTHQNVR
jgi:ABC-type glutathione transport system ATPase component